MPDRLLAYLLGALDRDDELEIERLLETDEDFRQLLETVRLALIPLHGRDKLIEPPAGLAVRTCHLLRLTYRTDLS